MANKVKYGLKNVYYAKATISATAGTATYGTPVRWPGAVNLALDPEGENSNFFADNIAFATFAANAGYSGDFESALIPDSFRVDIMGEVVDSNGVQVEDAGATPGHFALLFQFEGDEKATRHVLYNCTANRPSINGQTTEDTVEAQTEKIELTATSIYNSNLQKDVAKAKCTYSTTTSTTYDNWFEAVYQS